MATITRVNALNTAIALFADDAPEKDVLIRLRDSLSKSKEGVSDAVERNRAIGQQILPQLPIGVLFTCADITAIVKGDFNLNAKGGYSAQHVSKVLQQLAKDDFLTVHHVGRVTLYERK